MKRNIKFLGVFLIALFIGLIKVNAASYGINTCSGTNDTGNCTLSYVVDQNISDKFNVLNVIIRVGNGRTFTNMKVVNGWTMLSKSEESNDNEKIITLKLLYNAGKIPKGTQAYLTYSTTIIDYQYLDCTMDYSPWLGNESGKCEYKNGLYFDKDGNIVSETQYRQSCSCIPAENGKYYYNGNIVEQIDYIKSCNPPACAQLSDGTYYGPNKTVVTAEEFDALCNEHTCSKVPGTDKYYDTNGDQVDETTYLQHCFPHECEKVGNLYYGLDGDPVTEEKYKEDCFPEKPKYCQVDGSKYYGIDGTEVSKEKYEEDCFDRKCSMTADGTYYDKDGKKTDKKTYVKQCTTIKQCSVVEGMYFDKDGNEVTKEEYQKSCMKCGKDESNNKWYDENGAETTKENWEVMCTPHKCQVFGDKYFNDKGKLVTKAEYDKACTNPKTGDKETIALYTYIVIGVAVTFAIIFGTRKFSKLRRI